MQVVKHRIISTRTKGAFAPETEEKMIVETTNYYAKSGMENEVLAQRHRATAIRVGLGLPAGRTFVRLESDGPSVKWQCEFESRDAYLEDLEVRKGSLEFSDARAQMHKLIERFERHIHELAD